MHRFLRNQNFRSLNYLLERENEDLKEFIIPFVGLKKELHAYDYSIDSSFFQLFENSPIREGVLEVHLSLTKESNFFELDFQIEGKVETECDRCSDKFYKGVEAKDQVILQLGNANSVQSDDKLDIFSIPADSISFNVAHLIYEIVVLSLPIRKNCDEDSVDGKKCNKQIVQYLDGNQPTQEETTMDPRWAKLLSLKNNNKQSN